MSLNLLLQQPRDVARWHRVRGRRHPIAAVLPTLPLLLVFLVTEQRQISRFAAGFGCTWPQAWRGVGPLTREQQRGNLHAGGAKWKGTGVVWGERRGKNEGPHICSPHLFIQAHRALRVFEGPSGVHPIQRVASDLAAQ